MPKAPYLPKLQPKLPQSPIFKERFIKHKLINAQRDSKTESPVSPSNPFLSLLASPLRQDRTRRDIVIPRDLLIKFSIVRDSKEGSGKLWMSPDLRGDFPKSSIGSSYFVNRNIANMSLSKPELKAVKYEKIANLNLYNDHTVYDTLRDVQWNEDNYRIIDEVYNEMIAEQIQHVRIDDSYTGPEVCINLRPDKMFKFFGADEISGNLVFNLERMRGRMSNCYALIKKRVGNGDQLVLGFQTAENKTFIETFVKLYLFHYERAKET
ncbi:hypothetical protein WICPIJ_007681 [Wickerhamomyces pijperi]|uniref:Required for respiratory growth protein 8, mitochondrial n=1 Tax=Wickerhamomyces pijperi TaxID=599730 RepID=A0A9P8PZE9_WICPI|nr:hypothetical protein WICPIJ_007681 [Wickerhamomyces pijperi]